MYQYRKAEALRLSTYPREVFKMRLLKEVKRIRTRHGTGMVGALIAIAAVGLLVVPISRWYLSLSDGAHNVIE